MNKYSTISNNDEFINDLQKLNKNELVNLIYNFYNQLKLEAESQIKDNINVRQDEYGRIKITQVNRLKIMAKTYK